MAAVIERAVPTARPLRPDSSSRRVARSNARAVRRSAVLAVGLAVCYLLSGRMGGDLAAQMAHADFARSHPVSPIDLRWFGGSMPLGYSLWTPPVMAVLGARVTGAVATVSAVALFAVLLRRLGAPRQLLAGLAAAVTFSASLAEGRVTFACGLAAGLGALVVLSGGSTARRLAVGAALSLIAGAASPVVAVYLLLAGAALLVRRRVAVAGALAAAALPLLLTSAVFADPGRQVFSANDAIRSVLATSLVLIVVPKRFKVLRAGALLALVMVILAAALPTPLGSNSTRLSLLFAVPLVAAYGRARGCLAALSVLAIAVAQPPFVFGTLAGAGRAVTGAGYFAPLVDELRARGPLTGRVEIPELTGHWDAAYLARSVPLSRGWLRQLDTHLNDDVFYRHLPTVASYRGFLDRTATQYVAVADARPTFYGRRELSLIHTGVPYLTAVWSDLHWTLYAVQQPTPVVAQPARLVMYGAEKIVLDAPANSEIVIRVRWLPWLTVEGTSGSCLRRDGEAVVLRSGVAGRYVVTSSLTHRSRRC